MRKLSIKNARVHVELDFSLAGSVLAGTVDGSVSEVRSDFEVEADGPEEELLRVVRLAKRGCFAEALVKNPVPMRSTARLNGATLADLD